MSKNREFISRNKILDSKCVGGARYYLGSSIDKANPFVVKTYDYGDFYRGRFWFADPASSVNIEGTPEEYGRRRIVAVLKEREIHETRLDLGAGSLNILRELSALKSRHSFRFVSADISGPWTSNTSSSVSTMETGMLDLDPGMTRANKITNVQYDMNSGVWPFKENSFDTIVSCMAIHHVKPDNKKFILSNIWKSLIPGGRFVLMDFFTKNQTQHKVTEAGEKGPNECGGYGSSIREFLENAREVGFKFDNGISRLLISGADNLTETDFGEASRNPGLSIQVNKASWFINLLK